MMMQDSMIRMKWMMKYRKGDMGRPAYIMSLFSLSLTLFDQSLLQYSTYSLFIFFTLSLSLSSLTIRTDKNSRILEVNG